MSFLIVIASLPIAFAAGSLPTALILGRIRGVDIRTQGSGNVGATNAFRVLGAPMGAACLVVDMLKGALPTLLLPLLFSEGTGHGWVWGVGIAAIAGHMFSPFLKFKGGKGVATSLGVLLAIAPVPVGIVAAAGVTIIAVTGYVSLASVTGSIALPILVAVFGTRLSGDGRDWLSFGITAALSAMIVWKHRSNIGRLMRGEESKVFHKNKKTGEK